jgi:hypothetical protein
MMSNIRRILGMAALAAAIIHLGKIEDQIHGSC